MNEQPLRVYIGLDKRFGVDAADVCAKSIRKHASIPIDITLLDQDWLRRIGLYRRQFYVEDGQQFDAVDGKPFSTEFSFSRFLVPSLQPEGWAVFCDGDFLFREDIAQLASQFDDRFAAMCVKHSYASQEGTKMLGQVQTSYKRKNWSSLMAWNCTHSSTRMLTPFLVNTSPGNWLHRLRWLPDGEIGELPLSWNWLDGYSSDALVAKAAHFTRGTPDMPGWESTRYSKEWWAVKNGD